jgi:hypothetical protein
MRHHLENTESVNPPQKLVSNGPARFEMLGTLGTLGSLGSLGSQELETSKKTRQQKTHHHTLGIQQLDVIIRIGKVRINHVAQDLGKDIRASVVHNQRGENHGETRQ